MPILCEPSAKARDLIRSIGGEVRAADSLQAVTQLLAADPAEILVVIGPDVPVPDALTFASGLRMTRPAVGVVLALDYVDVSMLTQALRAGVREVVPAGDQVALNAACRRSYEVSQRLLASAPAASVSATREGQVVTVFAAKGGCGKTTLALNLAVALAADPSSQVCLVDLDLAFGDVAISVQLDPARTIVDALPMTGHLDSTGASSLLTRYRPNLEMLLAPITPGDAEKIPPALVGELLTVLRGIFDYVVVDTPAQFSEHVLTAMDASAHHILLTTPDVPALKNLRITLDMLDLLSYPRSIRSVVLNRSDSKVGLSLDDVARVVRSPIAAHIPSSREVPISINKGTPLTLANPGHPVSQAIVRFVRERLSDKPETADARRGTRTRGRRRSA
ncbi:MAG TPA: P-loop NTPase [Streptosporangiaceae bacterium]|nr:P-loop NTPase [Streptosporangiaceae bacterium]